MNMFRVIGKTEWQRKKGRFLMLMAGVVLFSAFSASAAFADSSARAGGGYVGPGSSASAGGGYVGPGPDLVTVEQARAMPDDAPVALQGYIIQNLGKKDYVFKDATGTIPVKIGRDEWAGQLIGPDDLVKLYGEVDQHRRGVDIDVDRVIKQ